MADGVLRVEWESPVTAGVSLTRAGAWPPELGVGAGGAPSTEVSQPSCL